MDNLTIKSDKYIKLNYDLNFSYRCKKCGFNGFIIEKNGNAICGQCRSIYQYNIALDTWVKIKFEKKEDIYEIFENYMFNCPECTDVLYKLHKSNTITCYNPKCRSTYIIDSGKIYTLNNKIDIKKDQMLERILNDVINIKNNKPKTRRKKI